MADDENPTAVPVDNNADIGINESTIVSVQGTTVAPNNALRPMGLVVATADARTVPTTEIADAVAAAQSVIRLSNSVPTLPTLPPPLDDAPDDSSMNLDAIENYDGSLEMLMDEDGDSKMPATVSTKKQKRESRIKFKGQGILAQSSVYLKPDVDKEVATEHRAADHYMKGVIIDIPTKKNNNSYTIVWDVLGMASAIQQQDLCTTFFKTDDMFNVMKLVRKKYDELYSSPPTFHLKKKITEKSPSKNGPPKNKTKKKKKTKKKNKLETPKEKGHRKRTDIKMTPVPSPTALIEEPASSAIVSEIDVESESDDGSDIDDTDYTFQPRVYSIENDDVLPDDGYDPKLMEEDGEYDVEHVWNYEDLTKELEPPPNMYNGPGPCLKRGIAERLHNLLDAVAICGGMDYNFFKRLAANSNQFARNKLDQRHRYCGFPWKNITTEEMYRFFGVLLKMSIDNRKMGGYKAYFKAKPTVYLTNDYSMTLHSYPAWASKVFTLGRFQQLRAAFHPEVGESRVGDKVHQLRYALNCLNSSSRRTFIPGMDLSFDEGGVASRSKYNPVRQYNKDKPDKRRVDFFMMANATKKKYFILHADIYQGRNAANIDIPSSIRKLPTTQKAVVNAVIKCNLSMDPDGMRCLFMDNRYQCAELAILLRDSHQVLSCGTTRRNRNGWNNDLFNVTVKAEHGHLLRKFDPINKILYMQWKDNKVVNLISTLSISGVTTVERRIGAEKKQIQCEENIIRYVDKMNGVDVVDYHQKIAGGLAKVGHYKKWYKKTHNAICDFMIHQGRVGWNMSADENEHLQRRELTTWEFQAVLAEELIAFVDVERDSSFVGSAVEASAMDLIVSGHRPIEVSRKSRRNCCVCRMEENIISSLELKNRKQNESGNRVDQGAMKFDLGRSARQQTNLCECAFPDCTLVCHVVRSSSNKRMIFDLPQFKDLNCFEIAHKLERDGLFSCHPDAVKQKVGVRTSHPVWLKLRELYGMPNKKRPRRKLSGSRSSSSNEDSASNSNGDSSSSESSNASEASDDNGGDMEEI